MKYFMHFQTAFDERTEDDLAQVRRVYMLPNEINDKNKVLKDVQEPYFVTGMKMTDMDNQSIVEKWKELDRRWIESSPRFAYVMKKYGKNLFELYEELNHGKI